MKALVVLDELDLQDQQERYHSRSDVEESRFQSHQLRFLELELIGV